MYVGNLELVHKIQKSIAYEETKERIEIKDQAISSIVLDNCVVAAG
jgi:hypothetical protein